MSDSEDDFMSDKFLVVAQPVKAVQSYSERRHAEQLKSMRKGQANNKPKLKQLEEERRREGLNRSLFEDHVDSGEASSSTGGGGDAGKGTAMAMMMKMGWKVGEGLGRKRSASPPETSKRARVAGSETETVEHEVPRGGIGSGSRSSGGGGGGGGRTEPIRISMWAGRRGLTARSPSPPPLPSSTSGRNPDALDPKKLERLGRETDDFRTRQRREFKEREVERKGRAARERLIVLDAEKGVKFHPLHVFPADPLGTLPRPLLRLIYPAQAVSPSPSRSPSPEPIKAYGDNVSAAAKKREQMRRDMLEGTDGGEDDSDDDYDAFGERKGGGRALEGGIGEKDIQNEKEEERDYTGVDWESYVSGTKKVLSMQPAEYLQFVVSQLRHEHLFCFWCAYKYRSYDEMEGAGGCPGEDEDDH